MRDTRFLVSLAAMGLVIVNTANIGLHTNAKPITVYAAEAHQSAPETIVIDEAPIYRVDGKMLSEDLQKLLYSELEKHGTEDFFPIAVCQIYQESRYNPKAQSKSGKDQGLCQFRKYYFKDFAKEAGIPNADVWDAEDSIRVYAHLMSKYLHKTDSVEMALSHYYLGKNQYCANYVKEVMQWVPTRERVK